MSAGTRARCLPLAEWPEADRRGWQAAVAKGDLLLDDGPGARLKAATLQRHRTSYGRWLCWLQQEGRLEPDAPPGARATPEAVTGYVAELQAQNAPQSVLVRLQSLAVVLGWLDPDEAPKPWLRRILARLEATAKPVRDKRSRLRGADELLALGCRLMDSAEAGGKSPAAGAALSRRADDRHPRLPAAAARQPDRPRDRPAAAAPRGRLVDRDRCRGNQDRRAGVAPLPRRPGAGAGGLSRALAAAARQPQSGHPRRRRCGSPSRAAASARTTPTSASPGTPGKPSASRSTRICSAMPPPPPSPSPHPSRSASSAACSAIAASVPPRNTTTRPGTHRPHRHGTGCSTASPGSESAFRVALRLVPPRRFRRQYRSEAFDLVEIEDTGGFRKRISFFTSVPICPYLSPCGCWCQVDPHGQQ